MRILYQTTFYQVGNDNILSAFLVSDKPYPSMLLGEVFCSKDFPGLEAFSPYLQIVHTHQYHSTLNRGETHHQWLILTREYNQSSREVPIQDLSSLINQEMMGDM